MKAFFCTLAGLIVIAIVAAVIVGFIFWSRIPDMVSSNLSQKFRVPVQIDSFGLGWGKIDAKKITISNPQGSILAKAFSVDELDVLAPFTHYLKDRIIINEIDLQNVYLGLEFDSASGTTGNWTRIMGNLEKSMAATSSKKQAAAGRSVLIHRIVLTNIDVDVVYKKEGGKVKRLPRIPRMELTEISSEGGLPTDQILNSVLGQMLKEVFIKQNLKNMIQDFLNTPSPAQKYIQPFKGFFNAAPEESEKEELLTAS